jgi:hypothetical protein
MSTVRQGAEAVTLSDGRVLVVGGLPSWGADVELASAEIYDPDSDSWSPAGMLSAPRQASRSSRSRTVARSWPASELIGTVVEDGETFYPRSSATAAERFDPDAVVWSTAAGPDTEGSRPAAVAMRDGRVLVVSGTTTAVYDPATATWTVTEPLPGGRYDASAVLLPDGSVLVAGGWSDWPNPEETPSCPAADPHAWRFVP